MIDDIFSALTPVANVFDDFQISYFIGGSVAAAYYGHERATNDIDLVADLQEHQAQGLEARLSADYYVDAEMIRDAVRRKTSFNFIHFGTGLKIDVFILKSTPYMDEQMKRRTEIVLPPGGRSFPVASPEDTILAKLDWYHSGGEISERQWNDIFQLLQVKSNALDIYYMQNWAKKLGLLDLLERAITEAK